MFQVLGAIGLLVSSATIGMDKASVEVTAIAASGEKKDGAIETDEGCKKFADNFKAFKYAVYKTIGARTLELGEKKSETCEFGSYRVRVTLKEIVGDKIKIGLVFYKGKEEVGKQTVTISPGGKPQFTEIGEENNKATLFALSAAGK